MPRNLKHQLKSILPTLSDEANRIQDRQIKERYYLIKAVVQSKKSVVKACAEAGKSPDSFNMGGKRLLKQKSLKALKPISKKPKYSPKQTPKRVEKRVVQIRKAQPYLGPERV